MKKILKLPILSKKASRRKQLTKWSCGTNCMKHASIYYNGPNISEENLMRIGNTTEKAGTSLGGLIKIANKLGLNYELRYDSSISDLTQSIDNGNLAILSVQAWPNKKIQSGGWKGINSFGHYVLAYGYDNSTERLFYYDPWDGIFKNFSHKKLEERWHDDAEHFAIFFKK